MNKGMNILLTGGTGYVGSHCAALLLQAGYRVTLLDNLCNSSSAVVTKLRRLYPLEADQLQFVLADVNDSEALTEVFSQQRFDAVLHCAGLKAVGESWQLPLEYYQTNVSGTLNLLRLMQQYQVNCLLFSSSATVYAATPATEVQQPFTERSPCAPQTPYGRSKYMVEQILQDWAQANPQLSLVLLRYFNPAGAHRSGLLGEAPNGIPNNLLPFVAQVASGQRSAVQVFGADYPTVDGTGVRDYIHIEDLAEGHLLALQHHAQTPGLHLYNLGRGHGYSVLQVIAAFQRSCGRTLARQITGRRPGDTASSVACVDKARRQLGFVARRDLQQMTDDVWRWQQQWQAETATEATDEAV